jgi:PEP-CTERM motif
MGTKRDFKQPAFSGECKLTLNPPYQNSATHPKTMKNPARTLLKALSLAAFSTTAAFTLSSSAFAATIVSDTFTDGGVTDGADAQDVSWSALFNLNGGSPSVANTGSLPGTGNALNADASSTFSAITAALPTDTALNLAIGDTLTFSFNALYTQAPVNVGSGFRFGIASGNYAVGVLVNTGTTAGFSIAHDLDNTAGTNFLTGGGNHALGFSTGSAAGDTGTNNVTFTGMAVTTTYAMSISMTYVDATTISYTATVNGFTATATDKDDTGVNNTVGADFLTNFSGGRLLIRNGNLGSGTVGDFRVDDVVVDVTSAIPEPSTYAALAGLGVLGLAVLRRKNRAAA